MATDRLGKGTPTLLSTIKYRSVRIMKKPAAETAPRPRGRPRSVDRDAALARAMDVFWARGFEAASLDDLTSAMGVSRPTLYDAFGDKRDLFLRAIELYAGGLGSEPMAAFEAERDIAAAVRAFLCVSAENNTHPEHPPGCLIGCCAAMSVGVVPGVDERVTAAFAATEARLAERFAQERDHGTIAPHPLPADRAGLMVDLMNAQAVRARAGASRKDLLAGLDERVAGVLVARAAGDRAG